MLLVVASVAAAAWLVLERNNELFVLDWRDGETRVVRGSAPARLRHELARVLAAANVNVAQVRVTARAYSARLTAHGVDTATLQELRRALQAVPFAKLQTADTASMRNRALRFLGVSSLVWLFGTADE
ncbi:MAG: DUF3634 family protein [Archangium sp.]